MGLAYESLAFLLCYGFLLFFLEACRLIGFLLFYFLPFLKRFGFVFCPLGLLSNRRLSLFTFDLFISMLKLLWFYCSELSFVWSRFGPLFKYLRLLSVTCNIHFLLLIVTFFSDCVSAMSLAF